MEWFLVRSFVNIFNFAGYASLYYKMTKQCFVAHNIHIVVNNNIGCNNVESVKSLFKNGATCCLQWQKNLKHTRYSFSFSRWFSSLVIMFFSRSICQLRSLCRAFSSSAERRCFSNSMFVCFSRSRAGKKALSMFFTTIRPPLFR